MSEFYDPDTLRRLQEEILSILDDFLEICDTYRLEYYGIAGTGIGAIRHQGFIPWDDDIDLAMPRRDFEKLCRIVARVPKYRERYYMLNAKTCPNYPLMTTRMCRRGSVFQEEVMKDVDCPFGIFLDLYVLDNVADDRLAYEVQSWSAWFFSKLLILREVPRPTLAFFGWKAGLVYRICGWVSRAMKTFGVSAGYLRKRCEAECRRYDRIRTRRMAFLPDTSPYWNVIDKDALYPLKTYPFEGRMLTFPGNIDAMLRAMYGDYMVMPPEDKRKTHTPYRLKFPDEDFDRVAGGKPVIPGNERAEKAGGVTE